jgi:anti-sigma regulatory factor (Ser/Thr protein kinase)
VKGRKDLVASAAYLPEPAAVAAARKFVRDTLRSWLDTAPGAEADGGLVDDAVLLTSELVTNAVTHATRNPNGKAEARGMTGETVLLVIAADDAGLRVDVHDGSGDLPVVSGYGAEADAETGRGLLLVTSLSAEWGYYRTATGKAVYFTLEFPPDVHETVSDGPD